MRTAILHYTRIANHVSKLMAMFLGGIMLMFGVWSVSNAVITATGLYLATEAIIDIIMITLEGEI